MKTLLFVDDDPNDRYLVEMGCAMAHVSFLLKTVASGVEAIRYLNAEGEFADRVEHPLPDLIFLDLKMPEMDGFQVLRWIRSHPATRMTPLAATPTGPITSSPSRRTLRCSSISCARRTNAWRLSRGTTTHWCSSPRRRESGLK
jgi:CheY-like chemotaxis protein